MTEKANVRDFLSKFPGGFARQNRYIVEFQMPSGVPTAGSWMNRQATVGAIQAIGNQLNRDGAVQIACHTLSMPPRASLVYQHAQYSAPFNVPYSQQLEPVTFTFYNDKDLSQRRFFEIWQTAVYNINDNSMNFFVEYAKDVHIHQLDRQGNRVYSITLYAAWPQAIGELQYGYRNE